MTTHHVHGATADEAKAERERDLATLTLLAEALDRQLPLERAAATVLGPDVRGHMDEYVRGMGITAAGWIAWWEFLWTEGEVSDVGCEHLETIEHGDGRYTLVGCWTGTRDGQRCVSAPVEASYVMRDGRIAEITTSRTNYTFFVPSMRTRVGAIWALLRFNLWRRKR